VGPGLGRCIAARRVDSPRLLRRIVLPQSLGSALFDSGASSGRTVSMPNHAIAATTVQQAPMTNAA
jgi:hypothetical protein